VYSLTDIGRSAFSTYVTTLSALLPSKTETNELLKVAAAPR
jgi:hypothetical protein